MGVLAMGVDVREEEGAEEEVEVEWMEMVGVEVVVVVEVKVVAGVMKDGEGEDTVDP